MFMQVLRTTVLESTHYTFITCSETLHDRTSSTGVTGMTFF